MAGNPGKSSKTDRQRKSPQNLRYINEQRHDKSHRRRLLKHLTRYPTDKASRSTLEFYQGRLGARGR